MWDLVRPGPRKQLMPRTASGRGNHFWCIAELEFRTDGTFFRSSPFKPDRLAHSSPIVAAEAPMKMRSSWPAIALGAAVVCGGCKGPMADVPGGSGTGGGVSNGDSGAGGGTGAVCQAAPPRTVRRLSQREYLNVVTDLLGARVAAVAAPILPLEPAVAGFDNQNNALLVSAAFQESLADAAQKMSAMVDAPTLAPCADAAGADAARSTACLQMFAPAFARKAFGRSPTADEVHPRLTGGPPRASHAGRAGRLHRRHGRRRAGNTVRADVGHQRARPGRAGAHLRRRADRRHAHAGPQTPARHPVVAGAADLPLGRSTFGPHRARAAGSPPVAVPADPAAAAHRAATGGGQPHRL